MRLILVQNYQIENHYTCQSVYPFEAESIASAIEEAVTNKRKADEESGFPSWGFNYIFRGIDISSNDSIEILSLDDWFTKNQIR